MTRQITHYDKDFLRECMEEISGKLFWKIRPISHFSSESKQKAFNTRFAGKTAGNVGKRGYLRVSISGKYYYVHRIIFLFTKDYLPDEIDHINGDKLDNSESNLRDATHQENTRNVKSTVGSSKYKGVSWSVDKQKWRVYCTDESRGQISCGRNRQRYVGQTVCEITAAKMYDSAALVLFGEFAWLNRDYFPEVGNE